MSSALLLHSCQLDGWLKSKKKNHNRRELYAITETQIVENGEAVILAIFHSSLLKGHLSIETEGEK